MYLILGGNSVSNKERGEEISHALGDENCLLQMYRHRSDSNVSSIDIDYEVEKVVSNIDVISNMNDNFSNTTIIAKSAGTIIALKIIEKLGFPKKLFLMGIPIHFAHDLGIDYATLFSVIKGNEKRVSIIQQSQDPAGSQKDIVQMLNSSGTDIANLNINSYPGSSHYYEVEKVVGMVGA